MKKYTTLLLNLALFVFVTIQGFSQTVTNTATLYGKFSEPTGQSVSVSIPVDIIRSNGKILELHLNISNVTQTATTLNLRVYELLYTSNVVETPKVEPPIVTPPLPVVDPPVTNIVVNPPTTVTNPPVVVNPSVTTNNVTLDVTLKLIDDSIKNVLLPGGIVKTNGQISNIIFDLASVPKDAIIIRVRLYDYIYDPNGNIIGIGTTNTPLPTTNDPPVITPPTDSVKFPVEVLGADQHTEEIKLVLNDNPSDIHGIKLQVHNLGFTNKMAISVNNSPWLNLNNTNVFFTKQFDKGMYGMGGGHNTLTFVVPFANNNIVASATNYIKFKFNDINKETVGYRVLDVDLVKAEPNGYELNFKHATDKDPTWGVRTNYINKYTSVNLATVKIKDDPSKWTPMSTDIAVINKGKDIWFNGNISERGVALNSKCADCHASDGYDLKYFNYSDKSIIARSKYHGLSNNDGVALASYIRSLNVPYQEKGRPWNPPYQPGPGLDSKPVSSWAAGAGIEAVADYDLQTYKALFPNGVEGGIKYDDGLAPINFGRSVNMREIPIVIQFPDWKDWLPRHHVKDVAPDIWDYISKTNGYRLPTYFENALTKYKTNDPMWNLKNLYWIHGETIGYAWVQMVQSTTLLRNHAQNPNDMNSWENVKIRNIITPAWHHYTAVKHWEIMNKLGLQDIGHEVFDINNKDNWNNPLWKSGYGGHDPVAFENTYGIPITKAIQKRRWYDTYTFHLAPHIMGNNIIEDMSNPLWNKLTWGTKSYMWYQLQMILDDTNKTPDRNIVDWGYLHALSNASVTHGTAEFDIFKIKSWAIQFLNGLKSDEAFFVNAGRPNNQISFEGRYYPLRSESHHLGSRTEPWDGRANSLGWFTFQVFSGSVAPIYQIPEQWNYVVKASTKLIDTEIDFMNKFDAAYLIDQGISKVHLDCWDSGIRYIGGDNNTLNKVINLRSRLWPDYVFVSKMNHVYPTPWPNLN